MSVGGAVSVWDKINGWMAPLDGLVDAVLRPVVAPLADMFDSVTGDSEEVRSTAQRWRDLATTLDQLVDHHRDVLQPLAGAWEGDAHEAFAASMKELQTKVEGLADSTRETAEFLDDAAMEVETAEELVATIIRELIEWALLSLVVGAALSVVTLGASAAAGAAAAAARGAVAYSKIATVLAKVASLLTQLANLLRAVNKMKFFSRNGFLIKTLLVKGLILKPVVQPLTGLSASPLTEAGRTGLQGLRDIIADEADDQLNGNDGMQTPLRDGLDNGLGPIGNIPEPIRSGLRGASEVIDKIDKGIPSPPLR
ncbi:WXG100 family type VII secretion target [Actinotalea sp. JY-7885]|uniref:WXG100 family type VII secretion target n=1 Tax=Actinotalea sp. JY-7885 TaxID=2758576 RepID=UPI00165E80FF|nr:WXG100 family type VII secretion target [Actinotalea sp. JY-7885]